jgi:uncharacterized protein YwqG
MNNLHRQLEQIGLRRMASAIQARSQQSIRLNAGKRSAQAVTRLGGRPNLLQDIPWPLRENGQPLSFIAQLDLSTLPQVRTLPLPKKGSLFFFYDADEQPWGFDPKDRGCSQVIYSPSSLTANGLRASHRDLDEEVRFKGFALTATLETTLPGINSGLLREFGATQEEFTAYLGLVDPPAPLHRMGGHANEVQGPLGLKAQLVSNGIYCGDLKGYAEGRKRGLDSGSADWRLLLQVDSEERAGMMWGDMGRLYFMIHKDDLRYRRFDKVWLILQCR